MSTTTRRLQSYHCTLHHFIDASGVEVTLSLHSTHTTRLVSLQLPHSARVAVSLHGCLSVPFSRERLSVDMSASRLVRGLTRHISSTSTTRLYHSASSSCSSSLLPHSLRSSLLSFSLRPSVPLRRHLFIQTQTTPNQNSLKFLPGKAVLPADHPTVDFSSPKQAALRSPLADALFHIVGVRGVLLAPDFLSVNVEDGSDWNVVKPEVYAAITDFYSSNQPALKEQLAKQAQPAAGAVEDSEVVAMIKELIESRIRPAVQEDGGDIAFIAFNEASGVCSVQMQGSCKGCASSSVTLKNGIENMLMHYVPEVTAVEEWKDEELEAVSNEELTRLEEGLKKIRQEKEAQKA